MAKKIISMNPGDPEIERLPIEYDSFIRAFACFPLYIPGTTYWKALQVFTIMHTTAHPFWEKKIKRLASADKVFTKNFSFFSFHVINWTKSFPLLGFSIKSRKYIIKIFEQEMEARMRNKGCRNAGNEEDDFLGWLTKNTDYPPEKIYDFLLGMLFAGHDTTSRAISLLIYFLQSCPKAVAQLRVNIKPLLTLLKLYAKFPSNFKSKYFCNYHKFDLIDVLHITSIQVL